MTVQPQNVSITVPVGQAIEHVKTVLFNPSGFEKWFTIGFCAWLAHLGQQGFGGSFGRGGRLGNANFQESVQRAREYVTNNFHWILPVVIAVVSLGFVLWLLMIWLSSRGKFMFLHCVALDKAEVIAPWQRYAREGASLFWFRLIVGLIELIAILPFAVGIAVLVWLMVQHGAIESGKLLGVVGAGFVCLLMGLAFWIIAKLTTDFVVPIMLLRGEPCIRAWGVLQGLLASNLGGFVFYFLFQILLSLAIGACVLALVLVTCCVAGCLLAIPYIGTVLFLPVLMFKRAYSIFYLRQYGSDYDVFKLESGPVPSVP